jgi:hypothetical protein
MTEKTTGAGDQVVTSDTASVFNVNYFKVLLNEN